MKKLFLISFLLMFATTATASTIIIIIKPCVDHSPSMLIGKVGKDRTKEKIQYNKEIKPEKNFVLDCSRGKRKI